MNGKHPSSGVIMKVGEALDVADFDGAILALTHAKGELLPNSSSDDDDDPATASSSTRRKRRRKPSLLDPSGYPRVASLNRDQVGALVEACWARCHGKAIAAKGRLRALRALGKRDLAEQVPESVRGEGKPLSYVATQLGALVILKALLRGSPAVLRAVQELRS